MMLRTKGVYVAAGSACTANSAKPSHVLKAIGLSDEDARCTIRLTLSDRLTDLQVHWAADAIIRCVEVLREPMPADYTF